jgi:hypothetical protein
MNKINEEDKKFIDNIINELREKTKLLENYADNNDVLGIWLISIKLSALVDCLKDFVDEKKRTDEVIVYE